VSLHILYQATKKEGVVMADSLGGAGFLGGRWAFALFLILILLFFADD
jgi:hypothetical protein